MTRALFIAACLILGTPGCESSDDDSTPLGPGSDAAADAPANGDTPPSPDGVESELAEAESEDGPVGRYATSGGATDDYCNECRHPFRRPL